MPNVSTILDPDIFQVLEQECKNSGMSKSSYVKKLLENKLTGISEPQTQQFRAQPPAEQPLQQSKEQEKQNEKSKEISDEELEERINSRLDLMEENEKLKKINLNLGERINQFDNRFKKHESDIEFLKKELDIADRNFKNIMEQLNKV